MPAVVDAQEANRDRGLVTISLQGLNQREDVADDHWLSVGQEMGMTHHLGETSYFGEWSPYFNLNSNSSTTYGFLVGRSGVVRWRGDLGSNQEEFLEALELALAVPAVPPLPEGVAPELDKALQGYVSGDLGKARKEAEKVRRKLAKSRKPEGQVVAAQAAGLVEALTTYEDELFERAQAARESGDAEALTRALNALRASFPRGTHAKALKALTKGVAADPELEAAAESWSAWFELAEERPALFPARRDKASERFAKRLARFVDDHGPGAVNELARAWLERWETSS